jgi:hypothetical protein
LVFLPPVVTFTPPPCLEIRIPTDHAAALHR